MRAAKNMKTSEFNENYRLESSSRGIRAIPKLGKSGIRPDVLTADGEPFDSEKVYHFYNAGDGKVRESTGLRRVDDDHLGSLGLRIVAIAKLRSVKDDALADGQKCFLDEIQKLRERIIAFEVQKTPKARSLKSYLMAKSTGGGEADFFE
jgi:hypothetical protein